MRKKPGDRWLTSELGCPDCAGVLRVNGSGNRHPIYECYVGHRFTTASLLQAKEAQLESALWSTQVLLAHVEMVCHTILRDKRQAARMQRPVRQRMREAQAQQQTIRDIIESTHVCELTDL